MIRTEQRKAPGPVSGGLSLRGVSKTFGGPSGPVTAVDRLELEVETGELLAVLGPSGCGKTTLLRLICGFEAPTEGRILLDGRDLAGVPPNRRGVSMVFQNYALFPHMTVRDNVAYGLRAAGVSRRETARRTEEALSMMGLTELAERFPSQLSGGQQQRTALARAVVIEPGVLLFDEPLCNLDAQLRERMRQELRALQKSLGITALYVTHDQGEAMAIADRIAVMKDGVLCQTGTPEQIYEEPRSRFAASFLGRMNFLEGILERGDRSGAVVRVGDRLISVPCPGEMEGTEPGGTCCLAIRPEALTLSREGDGVPAVVTGVTYLGARVEYTLQLAGRSLMAERSTAGGERRCAVGDQVFVQPEPDRMRVLK